MLAMGVRRLFSRRGQNFPGKGTEAKTYQLPKKHVKSQKNILFWPTRGGGKGPLLPSPADAHDACSIFRCTFLIVSIFSISMDILCLREKPIKYVVIIYCYSDINRTNYFLPTSCLLCENKCLMY